MAPLPWIQTEPKRVPVIAEIGVNHDGLMDRATRLIDVAAEAGADAVKFQYFRSSRLLAHEAELADYQRGTAADAAALLRPLELSLDALATLLERADRRGLLGLVTPFSPADPAELAALPKLAAIKIASPDAVNPLLLDAAVATGKPLLISTGACELDELGHAVDAVRRSGGALLQCVSAYPTPAHLASLGGIPALAAYSGMPAGYSDHTAGHHTGADAVAAGACVLEKHLTHDRTAAGPDHAASLDPKGFAAYVQAVRSAAPVSRVPTAEKRCLAIEADVRRVSRQSLAVAHDLPAGHTLTRSDLTTRRPGTGLPAAGWTRLPGQRLVRPVPAGRLLRAEDFGPAFKPAPESGR